MTRSILDRIHELGEDVRDQHMDGFYNLAAKKRLYKILWETERQLSMCSTFVTEDEWLEENKPRIEA